MFSVTALGKAFKTIVYSVWKGIPYGRMLVTPTNPQSGAQGDRRLILGGLGRSSKYVQLASSFYDYAKAVTPAGQSWISRYIQYVADTHMADSTAYEAEITEVDAHTAAADFDSEAAALGLTNLDIAYKATANEFKRKLQLYEVAKYATDQYLFDNTKFNAAPYTTALASWTLTEIQAMVADFSP